MWYFAGGDAGFYFAEQLQRLSWLPVSWHSEFGFGVSTLVRMWFDYPYQLFLKLLSSFGFSWFIIDKVLWLVVLVLGTYSSYTLGKYIFEKKLPAAFTSLVYMINTYSLLLFAGGQIGVALAYAFAPFVLLKFIQKNNQQPRTSNQELTTRNQEPITNGLYLALLIAFDLRLACLLLGVIILYRIFTKTFHFLKIGISLLVAVLIHSFWILPTVLTRTGPSVMGEDFTNPGMLKFLSVADFSHALSLLHPNWPENLFGKVYFLQSEFLILPILAFVSLLFLSKNHEPRTKNQEPILFFALLALIGAFFAKGTQAPFGGIFLWCFQNIPGFIMFRDPTKFYLFIALGYSILVPFTIEQIANIMSIKYQVSSIKYKNKIRNTLCFILYTLFVVFWLFTLRAVFTGEVKGNFYPLRLPQEYVSLKNQLVTDVIPSRTLWIPNKENFAYYSDVHPIMTSTAAASIDSSIKYIIVPVDVNRSIFLNDYKYDSVMRNNIIEELSNKGLLRDERFQNLAVFENPQFQEMKITIPDIVSVQQNYANIGVIISAVALVVVFILILWP